MNMIIRKLSLALLLLALSSSSLFGFATMMANSKRGATLITTNVNNADVYINDKKVGEITEGKYAFKVIPNGDNSVLVRGRHMLESLLVGGGITSGIRSETSYGDIIYKDDIKGQYKINIPRTGKNAILTIKKEGYEDFTFTLKTERDNWFWWNFVLGFGFFVDSVFTDNSMQYTPKHIFANMIKK